MFTSSCTRAHLDRKSSTMSHFHLRNKRELRAALAELKRKKVDIEDPGNEIGSEGGNSKNMGLWFQDPDGYRWELSVLAKQRRKRRKRA